MTSYTAKDAKQFFVDKILEQAALDGVELSDDERQMLWWSETAPDSIADSELAERLARVTSDFDYEIKMASLLFHSFERETSSNPGAKETWKEARSVLAKHDHYILVVIDQAVGNQLRPWWKFW